MVGNGGKNRSPATPGGLGDGSDVDERSRRAPPHTHTAWHNDYFTLTDNRSFPNLRMQIRPRFATDAFLGDKLCSKTLRPELFGDTRESPD